MIIDFYDDLGESFLVSLGEEDPPALLKEASWREGYELLDRDFAVILVDEENQEHRKYACHDGGNIAMSMWYLEQAAPYLPDVVVKVAAYNLSKAAGENPDPPEFTEEEQRWLIDERRVLFKEATMLSMGMMRPPTGQMPQSPMPMASAASRSPQTQGPATASAGRMAARSQAPMQQTGGMTRTASSPFDLLRETVDCWDDLDPYDRHDRAVILTKEASEYGVRVPDYIHKYAGETLNPAFEFLMGQRCSFTASDTLRNDYMRLSKVAHALDPEDAIEALYLIDEQANLLTRYGDNIPDPVLCVYGQTKKEAEFSWMDGTHMVNAAQLQRYANAPYCSYTMGELFSEELCGKFRKDPVGTFKSLPREQKIILSRLATQSGVDNDGGFYGN